MDRSATLPARPGSRPVRVRRVRQHFLQDPDRGRDLAALEIRAAEPGERGHTGDRIGRELDAGHAAVGVITWDFETKAVADKLTELGRTPETHEVAKVTAKDQ